MRAPDDEFLELARRRGIEVPPGGITDEWIEMLWRHEVELFAHTLAGRYGIKLIGFRLNKATPTRDPRV